MNVVEEGSVVNQAIQSERSGRAIRACMSSANAVELRRARSTLDVEVH